MVKGRPAEPAEVQAAKGNWGKRPGGDCSHRRARSADGCGRMRTARRFFLRRCFHWLVDGADGADGTFLLESKRDKEIEVI